MKPKWRVWKGAFGWSVMCPYVVQDCRCTAGEDSWQEAMLHVKTTERLMREAGRA